MIDTLKSMFDSLVRTYSPMIVGAILGFLATFLPIIPDEVEQGLIVLLSLAFQMVWYFIARLIEVTKGRASKLITLGLTKSEPVYGEVVAEGTHNPDLKIVDTEGASG